MTHEKISKTLDYWREGLISKNKVLDLIWGQPFDGLTEKINTTKSASPTSPATEDSSVAGNSGNETDFVTKTMTADEIMAGKMAKDLHQIREQLLDLGKYQTNLLGESGYMLVRMYADAERLDSHLRRRWNTPTPTQPNQ